VGDSGVTVTVLGSPPSSDERHGAADGDNTISIPLAGHGTAEPNGGSPSLDTSFRARASLENPRSVRSIKSAQPLGEPTRITITEPVSSVTKPLKSDSPESVLQLLRQVLSGGTAQVRLDRALVEAGVGTMERGQQAAGVCGVEGQGGYYEGAWSSLPRGRVLRATFVESKQVCRANGV
jgi:hypothetical protein